MSEVFDIHDEFKVIKQLPMNGINFESLARLYLPLIGLDAFGLYHFLLNLPEDKFFTHKIIFDSLGLVNQSIINSARHKLEAVGLIDVYINNSKKSIYLMHQPLSFDEFSQNVVLSNLLETQIGPNQYQILMKEKEVSFRGYKNISKKFNEVYDVETNDDVLSDFVKTKLSRGLQFDRSFFDYLIFKEIIGTSLLDESLLDDEEFKENIFRIAYIYQLNEEQMKEAVIMTIELDRDFNYDQLAKNAKKLFQNKNKSTKTTIKAKTNDAFIKSTGDSTRDQVIHYFNSTHPTDLLKELSGINPSVSEMQLVNDLLQNTNFPIGVINVMISFVNTEKNGVLPSYNYFEKIANTWARAGVKTTEDALNFITQPRETKQKKSQTGYSRRNKRVAKVPEWYDEYEQSVEQYTQSKQEEYSDEERQKIIEEAKRLLG